ncbi:MAG: carbohydrate ABC transporter permease [Defluviitaleaceae bacterium]|nr:carbohydrate ABC transporter permease [Defluviitaleaceae bacterium]
MRALRRLFKQGKIGNRLNRGVGGDLLVVIFVGLFAAFSSLPLVFAIMHSLKPLGELFLFPPRFFVMEPTFENYVSLFQVTTNMWVPITRYLYNSLFITFAGSFGQIIVVALAAYPLAKHVFPGRQALNQLVIFALLFSTTVLMVPSFVIMTYLGLVDTHLAVILPAMQRTIGLFLMVSFMYQIPTDSIEAARIDGCGEFGILWKIVMPVVKPATMTMLIFAFQELWRSTGDGFIFTENLKTLPVAFSQIQAVGIARLGMFAAASAIMMVPPIILFFVAQHRVMETMAHSGIKG